MSDTSSPAPGDRDTGTHDRSPLTWLVAAAAVLLIAAGGSVRVLGQTAATAPRRRHSRR